MRVLPSISTDEIWRLIEDNGFDRKTIEQTEPSYEIILGLYKALSTIRQKEME